MTNRAWSSAALTEHLDDGTTIDAVGTEVTAEPGTAQLTGPEATLRRTLHERGFRMTPQRQLVLDAVAQLGHATPEQICASVQRLAPAVNITTVYRTLDLLERIGVIRHTHLGHGAPSYSVHEHEHVHLVCHRCGKLEEIPTSLLEQLAERVRGERGFRLDATHVALFGVCADCAADPDSCDDSKDGS